MLPFALLLYRYLLAGRLGPLSSTDEGLARAQHELFSARYEQAAGLYREVLKNDPHCGPAYDGLVRALLEAHHAEDAYRVADVGVQMAPGTAAATAAKGRALFRKGEIAKAEKAWRDALAIDPKNASAIEGMSRIQALLAKYKTAQTYIGMAHRIAPDDPGLMTSYASSLRGAEHLAMLRSALAIYDPDSREAKALRAHISSDEALGEKKVRKLTSGYHAYQMKMVELMDGPRHLRGYGLRVSFNGGHPVTLLLDTGAGGIAISPRAAEKFGLQQMGTEAGEARGIGDREARSSYRYVASSVKVGDLEWEDYPLSVFDTAKSPDFDGLIGVNAFSRFLVTLDFPNRAMELMPFAKENLPKDDSEAVDASALPPDLFRVYRWGHMLLVPSFVNTDPEARLFLIDSGSSANLIDGEVARLTTKTYGDSRTVVKGLQGSVKDVARADVELRFAGFRQRNPDLIAMDMTKTGDGLGLGVAGILGMPVLINLKVTIDYRDGGVRFEYKSK